MVRPGDSLWTIAQRVLGRAASTQRVATLVGRLWTRNADRIGSGSPDVLPAGITIRISEEQT